MDYRKAYDSRPHTWIWECLAQYNVNTTLRTFIKNSMGLWRTTLEVNSRSVAQVNIKCGIYPGDALTPLLFCIGLNALSQKITEWVRVQVQGQSHHQQATAQPSGWHRVSEHLHRVWTRPSQVQVGDSTEGCGESQGKRAAPTDPRNNIRPLCPKERGARNS